MGAANGGLYEPVDDTGVCESMSGFSKKCFRDLVDGRVAV